MSSIKQFIPPFDSVDSIVNYLREPSPQEVVSSTTTSTVADSTIINNSLKSTKKIKKEKESTSAINLMPINTQEIIYTLPSGRVRYGPITVRPRKQPSKTLFTGRRSKYEILSNDEEEKRRSRRERNRIAATKCREKRENVLAKLEIELNSEAHKYSCLMNAIQRLEQKKQNLERVVSNHMEICPFIQFNQTTTLQPSSSSMIFGDTSFLSSITEKPALPLPSDQIQLVARNDDEFSRFLQPELSLTNTDFNNSDLTNQFFNVENKTQQQSIQMNSSSLDRLLNNFQNPSQFTENNKNNNNSISDLYNSTYGSSSCGRQHSSSSEDDSLPSAHKNSYVY